MKTKILRILFLCVALLWVTVFSSPTMAAKDDVKFELIPEVEKSEYTDDVKDLWEIKSSGNFAEIYNQKAKSFGDENKKGGIKECSGLGEQFASGIMNRDTILCLMAQVVSFVSNLALVVWALMIIYAGYLYATSVFNGGNVGKWADAIKRAIIGIVVVIFSYAILNLLINAFL